MKSVGQAGVEVGGKRRGRPAPSLWMVATLGVALGALGCGGHSKTPTHPGDDAATMFDARDAGAEGRDAPTERSGPEVTCSDAGAKKATGQPCTCAADCSSAFCVDGVCCSNACAQSCKTCAAAGSVGTCTSLVAGAKPRDATTCVAVDPATCGFDGTCDGAGACRRYVPGTICKAGTCNGDAVTGAFACDGSGRCKPGPTIICAPYSCDQTKGACFDTCSLSSQCVSGQQCVGASCGKKMKGASCAKDADCASGFCADGVCCNVGCQGGCVSCALPDRLGTCWPIEQGVADPRGVCIDQGGATCGANGMCDGFGGCEKYAPETVCIAPSCTGTRRNTPGTCDGLGTCRPQGVQNCSPFLCTGGACTQSCNSDADCDTGHACLSGQCGKKNLGQPCGASTECLSGTCVEGVCCDDACAGACRSCALASTMGHCTPLAAGAVDLKNVCVDEGATTCGANGRCDGSGGCQSYKPGTVCAPESCSSNVYTPASTCSATGQCTPPDSLPCAPYVCNGDTCFNACTTNQNCVSPNTCNSNSCGEKAIGASCSDSSECQSTFCAQGVCCASSCAGSCTSCALTGSLGTCTNVPNDAQDPAGLCADQGPASCGTNSKCQAGACEKYAQGTSCADSICPGGTTVFTPGSTCDGHGACVTPAASSCFPFQCGVNVCNASCTTDAECAAPAVCTNGSCGLKGIGKTCADTTECLSGFCAEGVCCDGACSGTCQSCVLSGTLGHCSNIVDGGTDPRGRCVDKGSASCATDGACDGQGACRVYAAGTACMAASCAAGASTLTQVRTCDGKGTCNAATTLSCAPYLCNGVSACKAACTVDADCLLPDICDPKTNLCGTKRRLGQTCALTTDCLTGNYCVDGVCCASSSCGLCQTCASGACANVVAGMPEPHAGCPANPPCGNTGNCNGGACEQAGMGVACGSASCTGATFTPISHCTGAGSCAVPATSGCSPYVCGAAACKTVCATDADCVAPFTCQGASPTRSCALKANGLACASGGQCISGNCVDGACCGSSSCPACQACNVSGTGACAPVAAGTTAPTTFCADQGAPSCGTNGKCDGGGGCQKYANGTGCSSAICTAGATSLTLAGACSGGSCMAGAQSCNGFKCAGSATCPAACASNMNCAGGFYCTGAGGTCAMMIAQGLACSTDNQCGTTHCVDGVCCGSASCGSCQACNVSGKAGTCAPLAAGTLDPKAVCVDNLAASCGTNGKCDGAGGCQKYADGTGCSSAVCTTGASSLTLAGACNGGSCMAGAQSCNGYKCTGGATCPATCGVDTDCSTGFYCTGAGGSCAQQGNAGDSCTADDQCGAGHAHCVDGVCCGTAACGSCQACNVSGSAGTCAPVGAGTVDPKHTCVDNGAPTCSTNGKCDGLGGCQKYANGTTCAPASCPALSSTLTLAGTCGGGSCGQTTQDCGAFMCNGTTACRTTCAGNGDCSTGNFCTAMPIGTCTGKLDLGSTCGGPSDGDQCKSGNCVDGVCCGSASCASCTACAAGTGACTPVLAGTPAPTSFCTDQGAPSCGTDGKCDGLGGCQKYANGTMCSSAICTTGATSLTLAGTCNLGSCSAGTQSCNGLKCTGGSTCPATCTLDTDCSTGFYCTGPGGSCAQQGNTGDSCTADDECGVGHAHCVDGVCCGTASCGGCSACNIMGSLGACAPLAQGTDPKNACADQGPSSCGTDGVCDGNGGCQKYANGTMCSSAICTTGATSLTLAGMCNLGSCSAGTQSCNGLKCTGGATCPATCTLDTDCANGFYCTGPGGSCAQEGNAGASCTADDQCGAGHAHCVDGVCCGTASCGGCSACNIMGSLGACAPLAQGTDPKNACADQGPSSCGTDGVCDGHGACEAYADGTTCAPASCLTGSTLTLAGTCGMGSCDTSQTQDCGAYKCDGMSACLQACGGPSDCSVGYFCSGVMCIAKLDVGKACTGNGDCANNQCVDGVCCGTSSCGCGVCTLVTGACTPLAAGADSNGFCAPSTPALCGQDGKCDGAGGCEHWNATTVCAGGTCDLTLNQQTGASLCDGMGACVAPMPTSCGLYACTPDLTACNTTCASNPDCSTNNCNVMTSMCEP